MRSCWSGAGAAICLFVTSCTGIIPDVPPDPVLPVREILLRTACELQDALRSLDTKRFQRFKAREWLITAALVPKVDTNLKGSAGFTRKSPYRGNPVRFTSWAMAPGLEVEAKGQRTGGVSFTFKSAQLITDQSLICDVAAPTFHALAQHLRIGEWLRRTAEAMDVAASAEIDKPQYNTVINIRFGANGAYTYNFPPGTDLAALGGNYTIDEQLNISMAPLSPPKQIQAPTLPSGDKFDGNPVTSRMITSAAAVEDAKTRIDTMQLEQAIRSLRFEAQ